MSDTPKAWIAIGLAAGLALTGCAAKKPAAPATPVPIRSQIPPPTAETIEHCVITKQENSNTVTCSCVPLNTKIDAKTGHTTLICKTKQEN
jgi:hypothetical protein